jgi:hypothetical protein
MHVATGRLILPSMTNPTPANIRSIARNDFESALRKGFWGSMISWFNGSSNELLPFDEVRKRLTLRGQHYLGLKEIPIDKIIGSVGRYHDFDRAFLPRRDESRVRWMSIDSAMLQDTPLPAVDVYKIGEIYFVKDGNHRVSVARKRGQAFIDAHVVEIDVGVPVTPTTNIDDLIRLQEKADFLIDTQLDTLRPQANIELSLPGGYDLINQHIHTHRWFMGEARKAAVSLADAIVDWYDTVYLPLINVIHEQKVLDKFHGRTEADLYLWIIEHLWYLREQCGCPTSFEDAASSFTRNYAPTPWRKLLNFFKHLLGKKS